MLPALLTNIYNPMKYRIWTGSEMEPWGRVQSIAPCNFEKGWKVLMFTGLIDKKGREIYEGDVLGGHPHGEAWVVYDNNHACWACSWYSEDPEWDGEDSLTQHVTVSDLLCNQMEDCGDAWRVIGNIYENPELIKA